MLGAACASSIESGADGGAANNRDVDLQWPIEAGVSTFITQSAARSEQPYPCGSGVNSQHILEQEDGENHDYENSLDIIARNMATNTDADQELIYDGRGTDIVAVADGTVVAVSTQQSECVRDAAAGNYIIIEHPSLLVDGTPVLSAYMHLNSRADVEESLECGLNPAPTPADGFHAPAVGTQVHAGQKIAELGNTGNSTGAHLHFQFATECTLDPRIGVDCPALSALEVSPFGFANVAVTHDDTCPAQLATGGPVAPRPSAAHYMNDGSYVTGTAL